MNSKNHSDILSNNIVMINIENNTRNIPIYITTIQKYIPISTGTISTKNNKTIENEKDKSNTSSITRTTGKKSFVSLIDHGGKNGITKSIFIESTITYSGIDMTGIVINLVDTPIEPKQNKLVQHGNNKEIKIKKIIFVTIKKLNGERKILKKKSHRSTMVNTLNVLI